MPRLPARFDWIVDPETSEKVALRLDKTTFEFQAHYGGAT